jgi:putative phosphoesterase
MVIKLGIISDTHGHIDERILNYLEGVDQIWHAGDIGSIQVIENLKKLAPVKAVYGNIDSGELRVAFSELLIEQLNGLKLMMTHIAGKYGVYHPKLKQQISLNRPGILICGHSHIAKVQYDHQNSMLYINPGAAGFHGFHRMRTMLRFDINHNGQPENMRLIELGINKKGA